VFLKSEVCTKKFRISMFNNNEKMDAILSFVVVTFT